MEEVVWLLASLLSFSSTHALNIDLLSILHL